MTRCLYFCIAAPCTELWILLSSPKMSLEPGSTKSWGLSWSNDSVIKHLLLFQRDLNLIPSTHIRWFTTTGNSNTELIPSSEIHRHLYSHMCIHTETHIINLCLFNIKRKTSPKMFGYGWTSCPLPCEGTAGPWRSRQAFTTLTLLVTQSSTSHSNYVACSQCYHSSTKDWERPWIQIIIL